jgi:hypothetical protein
MPIERAACFRGAVAHLSGGSPWRQRYQGTINHWQSAENGEKALECVF